MYDLSREVNNTPLKKLPSQNIWEEIDIGNTIEDDMI